MSSFFQSILDWLQQQFDTLFAYLNPWTWIYQAAVALAGQLPAPSGVIDLAASGMTAAAHTFGPYLAIADYFIDVHFLLLIAGLIFSIETGLGVFRLWRTARSVVV